MAEVFRKIKLFSIAVLVLALFAPVANTAYAATITQLNIPASVDARVIASSTDGTYIAYTAKEHAPSGGRILHRYNTITQADTAIAEIDNGLADMSSDGQEIIFSAWGTPNYTDSDLEQGRVYVWQASDSSYVQVSPEGSENYAMSPSMSDNGQYVAWTGQDGTFITNRTTDETIQIGDFNGISAPVLSGDGSKVAVTGWSNELNHQITSLYDTSTNTRLSYLDNAQFSVTSLSSDGNYGTGYAYASADQGDGITWFNFATSEYTVIANTADYQCVGDSLISYAALSSDGQAMTFASLSPALDPEATGSPLGYYTYYPDTGAIVNESGATTSTGVTGCPSTAVSGDSSNIFYTSDAAAGATQSLAARGMSVMSPSFAPIETHTNMYKAGIQEPKTKKTYMELKVKPVDNISANQEATLVAKVTRDKLKTDTIGKYKKGGWVTFSINGEIFAKAQLDDTGTAKAKIIVPNYGTTQKFTAFFAGNEKFSSSWVTQRVNVN